jgi:hypothetical protein
VCQLLGTRSLRGVYNSMMKGILCLTLLAVGTGALAQTPPDVPSGHWAAKAVTDLYQLGILKGYPEGLFRGNRLVSRYEMAQALGLFAQTGTKPLEALQKQLNDLRYRAGETTPTQDIEGLASLRKRLDGVESQVGELRVVRPTEAETLKTQLTDLLEKLAKLKEEVRIMRKSRQ